jgi:hypothetical protein
VPTQHTKAIPEIALFNPHVATLLDQLRVAFKLFLGLRKKKLSTPPKNFFFILEHEIQSWIKRIKWFDQLLQKETSLSFFAFCVLSEFWSDLRQS